MIRSYAFSPVVFGKAVWAVLNHLGLEMSSVETMNKWQSDFINIFPKLVADASIISGLESTTMSSIEDIVLSPNDKRATLNVFDYSQIVSASTLNLRLNWQVPGKFRAVAGLKSCENLCFTMPALRLMPGKIGCVTDLTMVPSNQSNSYFIRSAAKDRGLTNFAQIKELINSIDPMDPGKKCIIELCPSSFENVRANKWLKGLKLGNFFVNAAQTISRLNINKEGAALEIILLLGLSDTKPILPTDFRDQQGILDKSFFIKGANFPIASCCVALTDYHPSD